MCTRQVGGSIGVIEEFFGAPLGEDVTADVVRNLPPERFEVLRELRFCASAWLLLCLKRIRATFS